MITQGWRRTERRGLPVIAVLTALAMWGPARAESAGPVATGSVDLRLDTPSFPARLLLRRGEVHLMDPSRGEEASTLDMEIRLEILTNEGRERYRRMALSEGDASRLVSFSGRTLLPGGEMVPVAQDALFVQREDSTGESGRVTVVFPRVEVGAILHYRYRVRFDSHFYQSPWLFQSQLPTRRSEITYWIPSSIETLTWEHVAPGLRLERRSSRTSHGQRLDLWMEELPVIPDEPYGPPLRELASQFLLLVTGGVQQGDFSPRFDTWQGIREAALVQYREAQKKALQTRRQARSCLEKQPIDGVEERARALYRWVRDRIETEGLPTIFLPPRSGGLDEALLAGRASVAEKALLLMVMLREAEIPSRLVWAPDRRQGGIDLELPNPLWFRKVVVDTELEGREVMLDPSDRRLGFARLAPASEAVPALVLEHRRLEPVTLPALRAEENRRWIKIDLALTEEGRLQGAGELAILGQAAWDELRRLKPGEKILESLHRSMSAAWEEFEITDLVVERTADEQELFATWQMAQRAEAVTGAEVRLRLGRRLPARIDASLLEGARQTPVRLDFPFEDGMELRLHWSVGWQVGSLPRDVERRGPVGEVGTSTEVTPETGSLHHLSRLRLSRREIPLASYAELLELLAVEESEHAQVVVLSRR